ncbi:MAG: DUF6106 family protein [Eubacteriales bacterium]|nr:DUF6106 family protein [Eubacteriales bacterium]
MSDLYQEHLVKKEQTGGAKAGKYAMIGLTALFVAAGLLLTPLALLIALVLGLVTYFVVIPRTDLEYEYLFVNGELDIDKIMAKSKRKRVKSLNIQEADIIAPVTSHRMDYYNSNTKLKVWDLSSGNPQNKRYAIIIRDNGETCKVIVEPDENMAKAMRSSAPSKVFLD